jgi:predicted AAA+ superfamily ATPase
VHTRLILNELESWKKKPSRKPLILRGARQVGKTTAVELFGKTYPQYIRINLERKETAELFDQFDDVEKLTEALFFMNKINWQQRHETLLFIDEIQQVPKALSQLRYFYEQLPELHVIAAGSLLETVLSENISIPVGRVEYRVLRPVNFYEFLLALNETPAAEALTTMPLKEFMHDTLMQLFHTYTLIGGMPEIIQHYVKHHDLSALTDTYDAILVSYLDDVDKYARNSTMVQVIQHCIRSLFTEAGKRISFAGFGNSNYKSREIGEALRLLERIMLAHLIYPVLAAIPPMASDKRKKPRLQVLDTGLLNRFAGLQIDIVGTRSIDEIYEGRISEHITGQEILSTSFSALHSLHFWARNKKGSDAEVDFIIPFNNLLIPVEVKSGASGKLKSLQIFMDNCPHDIAIRLYNGKMNIHTAKTPLGKSYHLINLPYYMASQLENVLRWFTQKKT